MHLLPVRNNQSTVPILYITRLPKNYIINKIKKQELPDYILLTIGHTNTRVNTAHVITRIERANYQMKSHIPQIQH